MDAATLLADPAAIHLETYISEPNSITIVVRSVQAQPLCPKCQQPSVSLHSNYRRSLADLPWHGVAIQLQLLTRKFRCRNVHCSQKIFCERLPNVADAYARKTLRLNAALTLLAFALGGEAGARTARQLQLSISGDALLRRIRRFPLPATPTPEVLGVDDFAFRRGQHYGTILVDLQQRRVIDLLPDREAASLASWLQSHQGVQTVTRDRSGAYADGIRTGAPQATQIADRWHLLKNLREALERFLQGRQASLRAAAEVVRQAQRCHAAVLESGPTTILSSRNGKPSEDSRQRRLAQYRRVMKLRGQGLSVRAIARSLKMSRMTVYRYLNSEGFPERAPTKARGSKLAAYLSYLHRRWAEGCHNATQLWREIAEQGYGGQAAMVRRYVRGLRKHLSATSPAACRSAEIQNGFPDPSARQVAWWLLKEEADLRDGEPEFVGELFRLCPESKRAKELAGRFRDLVRKRQAEEYAGWLQTAPESEIREMVGFAEGLRRDQEAVEGALRYRWSNGQTEGQVNRLKYVKRQMYGRAKFDLLRARVLHKV